MTFRLKFTILVIISAILGFYACYSNAGNDFFGFPTHEFELDGTIGNVQGGRARTRGIMDMITKLFEQHSITFTFFAFILHFLDDLYKVEPDKNDKLFFNLDSPLFIWVILGAIIGMLISTPKGSNWDFIVWGLFYYWLASILMAKLFELAKN